MSSVITSNVTSGFIDLATFDEIEKYMYGGPDATAYFVRETRKSTWFTQVPVALSRAAGIPGFGQDWSVNISRAGDYLLQTWVRLKISSVTATNQGLIRWTQNLGHNLIRECSITFNDLVAARFDSYFLDFWTAFTVPADKKTVYDFMIGNSFPLTSAQTTIEEYPINVPLPFFYSRDSGVALPTAALPYNDMKINFSFRNWTELLVYYTNLAGPGEQGEAATTANVTTPPTISDCYVWANYAIVSNDERKRMACAPRDILIEQVQTAPRQTFAPGTTGYTPSYDIRFSHAVKVLFFSVRNKTTSSEWSNYSTFSPYINNVGVNSQNMNFLNGSDPIENASLIYENTARLSAMDSQYYSLVNPYYDAPVVPYAFFNGFNGNAFPFYIGGTSIVNIRQFPQFRQAIGYHSYSYSLDFNCLDPMGSTNYGKLTNVSIAPKASDAANYSAGSGSGQPEPSTVNQKYEFILTAVNNNIIRISGGALGFPVL